MVLLAVANIVLLVLVLVVLTVVLREARIHDRSITSGIGAIGNVQSRILRMTDTAAEHSDDLASNLRAAQSRADSADSTSAPGVAADAASRSDPSK